MDGAKRAMVEAVIRLSGAGSSAHVVCLVDVPHRDSVTLMRGVPAAVVRSPAPVLHADRCDLPSAFSYPEETTTRLPAWYIWADSIPGPAPRRGLWYRGGVHRGPLNGAGWECRIDRDGEEWRTRDCRSRWIS